MQIDRAKQLIISFLILGYFLFMYYYIFTLSNRYNYQGMFMISLMFLCMTGFVNLVFQIHEQQMKRLKDKFKDNQLKRFQNQYKRRET